MRASFLDPDLQHRFAEDGYVVIEVLDGDTARALGAEVPGATLGGGPFRSTLETSSPQERIEVDRRLRAAVGPRLDEVLDRHRWLHGAFTVQAPGPDGGRGDHLDPTIVDEDLAASVGAWIPLSTPSGAPATVSVIRGSHRHLRAVRGRGFPSPGELAAATARLAGHRTEVVVPRGSALVYDHRLVHAFPATGAGPVVGLTAAAVPREAGVFHHHRHPTGAVERFRVDHDLWLVDDLDGAPSHGLSHGRVPVELSCSSPPARPPARRRSFLDPDLQAAFERDGYVKLPLLSADEVARLAAAHDRSAPDQDPGFHTSIYAPDRAYKVAADEIAREVIGAHVDELFDDHRGFLGQWMVKQPGEASELGVHQDWTMVDESEFTSMMIWCPLVDTDGTTGSLRVVPGSHRFSDAVRGEPLTPFPLPFAGLDRRILHRDSVELHVRAGEAVVSDHRLVHCSGPNLSGRPRVVAGLLVAPREAPLRQSWVTDDGIVETYEVPDSFFVDGSYPGQGPAGLRLVDRAPADRVTFDEADLDRLLGRLPLDEAEPDSAEPEAEPPEAPAADEADPPPAAPPPLPRLPRRLWDALTPRTRHRIRRVVAPVRKRWPR